MKPARCATLFLWVCLTGNAWPADEAPSWFRELATRTLPAYGPKVPAVVLMEETRTTVDDSGRTESTTRKVIKVLSREGRSEAYGFQIYATGTAKVREMRGWLMAPSGALLALNKENQYDRAYDTGNAYDDLRLRGVNAASKADPGSVFGYESVVEETRPFTQFEWSFRKRLPVVASRYTLVLPPGWRAESMVFNHAPLPPMVQGTTYTWELKELPFLEPEPASPNLASLEPRVCVSYFPDISGRAPGKRLGVLPFQNWRQVSEWLTGISEPQAEPNSAISAKAQELTANSKTEFEKLQVIGRFLGTFRYVSIQTGTGRGGGYRPRLAGDVFVKEYGDCKDKATLTRALLKSVGIRSYLVVVNSIDRNYVHEEWPSPEQFNHAIVAVSVSAETQAPAVIVHPELGRLLIFDPTDSMTPAGDLPLAEQGGLALIAAGGKGALVRLPLTPPSFNMFQREVRATLAENGMISATMQEECQGQTAASARRIMFRQPRPEYLNMIESWIASGATGAVTSKIQPQDFLLQGRFVVSADFAAPAYAQMKAGRLLVFRPAILGRREVVFLTEPTRTLPILLNASVWKDVERIKLPQNFKVDEMPDPEKLLAPFGSYTVSCEMKEGELVFTRTMEIHSALIPAAQYSAVREFYEHVQMSDRSPVVLERR